MNIMIIAAMEKEIKKYMEFYHLEKLDDKKKIYKGTHQEKNIYLAECGIGKVNAAIMTQYLIDTYKPNYIINSGCAGSLIDDAKVLDTIVVDYATYHDFEPLRIMQMATPNQGKMECDKNLIKKAEDFLIKENLPYHIKPIASGDCFVTNATMRDEIQSKTNCYAVDMESASIAHAATISEIPFLIIRSISDFSDGVEEKEEEAANISAHIVEIIIENL